MPPPDNNITSEEGSTALADNTLEGPPAINEDVLVDPSTMTEELQAFQEALSTAIANDELQKVIGTFHSQYNSIPPFLILGSTSGGEEGGGGGGGDDVPGGGSGGDSGGTTTGNLGDPFVPPVTGGSDTGGDVVTIDQVNDTTGTTLQTNPSNGGLQVGGVVGVVLVVLVSVLAVASLVKLRRMSSTSSGSGTRSGTRRNRSNNGDMEEGNGANVKQSIVTNMKPPKNGDEEILVAVDESYAQSLIAVTSLDFDYDQEEKKVDDILLQTNAVEAANKEKDNDDDESDSDSTIAALLAATKSSDGTASGAPAGYTMTPAYSEDLVGKTINSKNKAAGSSSLDPINTSAEDGSVSAGSSGWSSNASPSTVGSKSRGSPRHASVLSSLAMIASNEDGNLSDRSPQVAQNSDTDPENDADDERDSSPEKTAVGKSIMVGTFASPTTANTARSPMSSEGIDTPTTRPALSHLDEAILNGDWAAVGATAALMAASISPGDGTKSRGSFFGSNRKRAPRRRSSSSSNALDREQSQKAAELNSLVQSQDWEAVMMAAARFDAESNMGEDGSRVSGGRSRTSSQASDGTPADCASNASTMDHSSLDRNSRAGRSSVQTSQTSGSQKERLKEIRAQVEKMVKDVVPDETENIDEMMAQFKGKEEELLETLRTMKERDVAKKARLESQKIARRNTRSKEKNEEFPGQQNSSHPEGKNDQAGTTESAVGVLSTSTDSLPKSLQQPSLSNSARQLEFFTTNAATSLLSDNTTWTTDDGTASGGVAGSVPATSGSFEQATKVDPDAAAAAAAEWAIQRSLSELMEKEHASSGGKK